MFVTLILLLKHLVSQIVEKNKSLNLAEMLSFTFISLWFVSNNFADVFLKQHWASKLPVEQLLHIYYTTSL